MGENREFLGLWITSGSIHEAKRRRATQVITCSFQCGKWLHMIGARASTGCELCKRERQQRQEAIDNIAAEAVAHIQSAVCKAQTKASSGPTAGVGSIFQAPSPNMGRRNVMSNSLGKTKTDNWSHCGEKRELETSYHGRMLQMKCKGYLLLIFTRLAEMLQTKITKMESRKTTKSRSR